MESEWFKIKKYPHIGKPITIKDQKWLSKYIPNEENIAKHNFLPFLHKSIVQRKFRADKDNTERNPCRKRIRILGKPKVRHIYYASHIDSLVFSYYSSLLSQYYEEKLMDLPFRDSVVAYRKIPCDDGSNSNKCNIEFARSSFEFIKKNADKKLTVIVADVTSFFDELDHKILKRQWSSILDAKSLPRDHYNVFKALTNLRYVEEDQLFKTFQKSIIVEKGIPNNSKKKMLKEISIKSISYLKEKKAVSFCDKKNFLKNHINLIVTKHQKKGIPQGSPISATLANIYMLDFDDKIYHEIKNINGFYQRYSDDIIIVCEQKNENFVLKEIRDQISSLVNLNINPDKTKVYHFEMHEGIFKGFEIDEKTKSENRNKTLEYLGFSFDGRKVLIKTAGFSKFYRSMKRSLRKGTSLALYSKNPDKRLFKSKYYKRFTHLGKNRKLIYRPNPSNPEKYIKTKKYDWGNYFSYVEKANNSLKNINNDNSIKRQSRKIWHKFHELIGFHEKRIKNKFNLYEP